MSRHVDAEQLGRFRAGDLKRSRTARIGAHLRGCGRCAELDRQLAGVTELLASVPAPPMPEHLASRISNSLAIEAARRAGQAADGIAAAGAADGTGRASRLARTGPADRAAGEHRGGRAGHAARDRAAGAARTRRRPRLGFPAPAAVRALAAAAAVAVLAGGGYAILRGTASPTYSSSASAPAAGEKAPPQSHSAEVPGAATTFGPVLQYRGNGGPASFRPVASGGDYRMPGLAAQVASTLARVGQARTGTQPASRPSRAAAPDQSPTATARFAGIPVGVIEGCVSRIAAGRQVLLVDLARYHGEPATVIVVSGPTPATDHLWVVGPGCSALSSDVLAQADLPR